MQIALHQQAHLAGARKCDRLCCRGRSIRCVDQAQRGDVDPRRLGHRLDLWRRADQHRNDQPGGCRVQDGQQRAGIDRIHHRRRHRGRDRSGLRWGRAGGSCRAILGPGQQGAHGVVAADPHIGQRDPLDAHLVGRRTGKRAAGDDRLALLVGADAIERHVAFRRFLLPHRDCRSNGVADAHRVAEAHILTQIDRSRTRQFGAERGGDQARPPHSLNDDMVEHVRCGIGGIDMRRVDVARNGCEQVDVALGDRVRQAGGLADGQFVERSVLDVKVGGSIRHGHYPSST